MAGSSSKNITTVEPTNEALNDKNLFSYKYRKNFIVLDGTPKKIAYIKDHKIIIYDPLNGQKENIFSDDKLIDFDLSSDETLLAYSLKENGFIGNADVYLKNLKTNETVRLTAANNTVSFGPKIFPDKSKVVYVSRIYDPQSKTFSDGEIRIIAASGDIQTSETLIKANLEPNSDCTQKDLFTPKIGIDSISPDGKVLLYWKNFHAFGCDLLDDTLFKSFDEQAFSLEKFSQSTFIQKGAYSFRGATTISGKTFWFNDHDFLSGNSILGPMDANTITYLDKNQNKTWELYNNKDWSGKDWYKKANASPVIYLQDVLKEGEDFYLVYLIYNKGYFVEKLAFGQKINLEGIENKKPLLKEGKIFFETDVKTMNFLNPNLIAYVRKNKDGNYNVFLYNNKTGEHKLIEQELTE